MIELTYTAFQEAFQEDFKYSDFFRDQASQDIGDVRREFIFYGLETGLEKVVLIQVTLGIKYESEHCFLRHAHFTLTPTIMGNKDKTRDEDAATDRDHSHSRANRDHS